MNRKAIAIACQGGGSQCAFIAGALRALFDRGVQDQYDIVGLSGTSGGALTASIAWMGLLERAQGSTRPIGDRILACWRDLTAQTPVEIAFDRICVDLLRLAERGVIPSVATSPSSPAFQAWARASALVIGRPEFTDLRAVLTKHLSFEAIPTLVRPESPVLLVAAADVLEGTIKIFSSTQHEITVDSLLASAAVPDIVPAAKVAGHAYWDGIFASNPPVFPFLRKTYMGNQTFPEEIWVVQVNRSRSDFVPELPSDISDRRNQLAGNLSLQHELEVIEMANMLIEEGALTDAFRARFGLNLTEAIAVRFIRMSPELQEHLDYPSKLSRQPGLIEQLIRDGEAQADAFLDKLGHVRAHGEPQALPEVEAVAPGAPRSL